MKYYEIMDKEEKGIYISFTEMIDAYNWLEKEKSSNPVRVEEQGLHVVEVDRLTTNERNEKAFAIANNALYFNDRSDYKSALWEVCNMLKPKFCCDDIGKKFIKE
ncbi:hypothetical protein [Clostridium botulinum]|uniref:hypothetical protein n=1 Tax=Clostridium botulinum TaxID=1491 RepID=UPI0014012E85|nr:hypothetical protein [Clostridium botulinum]MBY6916025.1 hypothetical protein [Clostridium botulinum]NFQ40202.1 hypothetical protein [Clostridium botulinum]